MSFNDSEHEQINALKKKISTLEWDISVLDKSETKTRKMQLLDEFKTKLNNLKQKIAKSNS